MKKINDIIKAIIVIILVWCSLTCTIQAFKNPKLTKTQIFENIPNSFVLDFN